MMEKLCCGTAIQLEGVTTRNTILQFKREQNHPLLSFPCMPVVVIVGIGEAYLFHPGTQQLRDRNSSSVRSQIKDGTS
jgi:hypothetical protein